MPELLDDPIERRLRADARGQTHALPDLDDMIDHVVTGAGPRRVFLATGFAAAAIVAVAGIGIGVADSGKDDAADRTIGPTVGTSRPDRSKVVPGYVPDGYRGGTSFPVRAEMSGTNKTVTVSGYEWQARNSDLDLIVTIAPLSEPEMFVPMNDTSPQAAGTVAGHPASLLDTEPNDPTPTRCLSWHDAKDRFLVCSGRRAHASPALELLNADELHKVADSLPR